jgi:hypothetical protein
MLKRTIALLIAASAVFLIPSGATNVSTLRAGVQATSESVLPNPPAGWTSPVNISNTPGVESRNPVIAVDAQGKAYLTWVDWPGYVGAGGERNMMFNSNRTGQWQTESTVIAPARYTSIDDVGFPTIAVNSAGSDVIVAYHDADYGRGVMQVFYSEWANGTWRSIENFSDTYKPSEYITLAFSPLDNTLFGIFMVDVDVPFELAMRYRDGQTGQTVPADIINVMNRASKYLYLTKYFAFDPKGTAHLVFTNHREAFYSKNSDPKNFNGWTGAVNISGGTGLTDTDPHVAVDNDGEAYVVWQALAGGNKEIFLRKTVNGQWLPDVENISGTPDESDLPAIAVNPATKEIYVAWQEIGGGTSKVLMKSYELQSGGSTKAWSSAVNMSSDFGTSGEPFLMWDAKGTLHLAFAATIGGDRTEIVYMAKPGIGFTITSPNGGESWEALKTFPITWTTQGAISNVKIEYSTDGGSNYSTIVASTPNTGSYSWTVPNTPSTNCLVRVSEATTGSPTDTSDAVFTIIKPSVQPPVNLALDTSLNSTRDRKINTLSWAANPQNASVTITSYKVYRKPAGAADTAFVVMASVGGTATQYADTDLDILTKYAYRVTAVSSLGAESVPTETVVETKKFEFAPVSITVTTVVNKTLFYQIKENTILFVPSPYNPSADVAGYDLYRRKTSESDSALAFVKSLDAATFSTKDAGLKGVQKYAYALKTRYTDGRISDFSTAVAEK